jgi:hypothetical protein
VPVNPQQQITAQLQQISDEIYEAFANIGVVSGNVAVVSNLLDLWNQSQQNSQSPMAFVCYMGETPWSGGGNVAAITHRVRREWVIRVKQGRGYTSNRGKTVLQFVDIVELVRDTIRAMFGVSEDYGVDFSGIKPVRLGDQVIDCYDVAFSTMNDLPPITTITGQ